MWVTPHDFRREAPSLAQWHIPFEYNGKLSNVANIKSQIKRIGTNKKATERNKAIKSQLRTLVRQTREAILSGDKAKAESTLKTAAKKLDKAVTKGVIHKNQAANRKSALAKKVASL
ncbi:small subunit ribosomal protein S20 [Mycetocola sp. 2940]